jgi:hypothetical protein
MYIDSYKFGRIVIDGAPYDSDVLILPDSVQDNWRRIHGHILSIEDLEAVIDARPTVLVVGCGASAVMRIPKETRKALKEQNILLEDFNTAKAVERFNQLSQAGTNVAAAFHLTC